MFIIYQKGKDMKDIIETPDFTIATYVYTDYAGNKIYFDGIVYWVVDENGMIDYYN